MHKSMRNKVQAVRKHESRIKALAFLNAPGLGKARIALVNNRHWFNRELKGELRTGVKA